MQTPSGRRIAPATQPDMKYVAERRWRRTLSDSHRGINWRQVGLLKRTDKIDTHHLLLVAEAAIVLGDRWTEQQKAELFHVPVQGGISSTSRLREAIRTYEYWGLSAGRGADHLDLLTWAMMNLAPPWHALAEAPRWEEVHPDEVFDFVEGYIRHHMTWPPVGVLRTRFGRVTNHRPAGDIPGQMDLSDEAVPLDENDELGYDFDRPEL